MSHYANAFALLDIQRKYEELCLRRKRLEEDPILNSSLLRALNEEEKALMKKATPLQKNVQRRDQLLDIRFK
jgi:hypothetical protein